MSSKGTYTSTAVRTVAAAVDRVAPRDPARWDGRAKAPAAGGLMAQVSEQRADQLWMVVGMLDRAVAREELPKTAGRRAPNLFTWPAIAAFWDLAVAGQLRFHEKDLGKPLPLATQRIVRDCLDILARLVVPDKVVRLPVVDQPSLKPVVGAKSRAALYRGVADLAAAGPLDRGGIGLSAAERDRLLAMVAIVLDAGTRSGELAALRLADLTADVSAVGVRRRQQKAPPNRVEEIAALAEVSEDAARQVLDGRLERRSEATRQRVLAAVAELEPLPEVEWYPLREGARVAVRRWLRTREQVVEALPVEGGRSGLWVTLRASKAGPPGITLLPRGLLNAYGRGVTALNWVMAGEYGWEPLPTTMEQLRRGVEATPLGGESVGALVAGHPGGGS